MKKLVLSLLLILFCAAPVLAQSAPDTGGTVVEGAPAGGSGGGSTPFTGGLLTSPLLLSEDPIASNEAVTLNYLNNQLGPINSTLPTVLLKTGGTMTGDITLKDNSLAASQAWVDAYVATIIAGLPSGGSGSGTISGQTIGCLPLATGTTASTGSSHVCDDSTKVNVSLPINAQGGITGPSGGTNTQMTYSYSGTPAAAPGTGNVPAGVQWTQAVPVTTPYSRSTAGAPATGLSYWINNSGQLQEEFVDLGNCTLVGTSLNCPGGGGGGSGVNPMSGTPTFTADSGAGTGPTITLSAGATDGNGTVTVTPGTSPNASAGVVTIKYGGTYPTIPFCTVSPANAAANALSGNASVYAAQSQQTALLFVVNVGSTALTAGTPYAWTWNCNLTGTPGSTGASETVSFSATPTFSTSMFTSYMQLTGNVTSFTLGAGADSQTKTIVLCQDATGGRTVTAPSNVHGFMQVSLVANKCSVGRYIYIAAISAWLADGAPVVGQ